MIMTVDGTVIAYDQGRYTSWAECRDLGKTMTSELEGNYTYTCVEWKKR